MWAEGSLPTWDDWHSHLQCESDVKSIYMEGVLKMGLSRF